ncbi:quinoprotein dehydrogenase-associated putative ABC transporter substrate-binding protein [Chthonobacter albigriseus]|uniref:quinoprotein dehydrogenase-associated putative ABC transporter substrate-binding protein n=1 Tax=Chthonobacter albigriseus TaxID=1683161 RepID=UPI0015EF562D|nr:quinoprotein dehydrogenase-associated putative ABC transporter substrate-binding protein [Chthonobacter albigriseus]
MSTVGMAAAVLLGVLARPAGAAEQKPVFNKQIIYEQMTAAEKTTARKAAKTRRYETLHFCADPGNMPLSNMAGEGIQNRIAKAVADRMGAKVSTFWRPYIERGLTRETFENNECDILIEVPFGYQRILTTVPIYRSTYVLATRTDRAIAISGFDDPQLKSLRIGVFQHSAFREALARHGKKEGLDIHVISQNADLEPWRQPWRQVQKVVDGELDAAGVWGPFAGWVKKNGAPLTLQPVNLMEDQVVLEFDLAFGVRTNDPVLKFALDFALEASRDEIRAILVDFGVPLVRCSTCVVDGDLPSHGTYFDRIVEEGDKRFTAVAPEAGRRIDAALADPGQIVDIAEVEADLAAGADVNELFQRAVVASDEARIDALLAKGADINRRSKQGTPAVIAAAQSRDTDLVAFLLDRGADIAATDLSGWSLLHHAILRNHQPTVRLLAERGADLSGRAPGDVTPLALAISEGKYWAAETLIAVGAPVDETFGTEKLTAMMIAATQYEANNRDIQIAQGPSIIELAEALRAKGADLDARSVHGVTAAMIAAGHNNAAMVGFLAEAGADLTARSNDGRTALDIATTIRADGAAKALRLYQKKT